MLGRIIVQPLRRGVDNPSAEFNRLLLESIDLVLGDFLGAQGRDIAYRSLAMYYALPRDEIPERVEYFGACLVQLFGVGGKAIGRQIAKNLYSKLGMNFLDEKDYRLHNYMDSLKANLKVECSLTVNH